MVSHGPSTVDIKIRDPKHTNKKICIDMDTNTLNKGKRDEIIKTFY